MIYMMRHGLSESNLMNTYSSSRDGMGLVEKGIIDVNATADYLLFRNIDGIVTSPVERARQTASIVGERLGLEPSVDVDLNERDHGRLEGMDIRAALERFGDTGLAYWKGERWPADIGMEILDDVKERLGRAIDRYSRSGNVVLVTHAEIIKTAMIMTAPMDPEEVRAHPCDNACILALGDGYWTMPVSYGMHEYSPLRGMVPH